jgi:hypothetical protein
MNALHLQLNTQEEGGGDGGIAAAVARVMQGAMLAVDGEEEREGEGEGDDEHERCVCMLWVLWVLVW